MKYGFVIRVYLPYIPPEAWGVFSRLHGVWNQLADAHRQLRAELRAHPICLCGTDVVLPPKPPKRPPKSPKRARKQQRKDDHLDCRALRWRAWWRDVCDQILLTAPGDGPPNFWREALSELHRRFSVAISEGPERHQEAVRRAKLMKLPPPGPDAGWPRSKSELEKIAVLIRRWGSGGECVETILSGRSRVLKLSPPPSSAYEPRIEEDGQIVRNPQSARRQRVVDGWLRIGSARVPIRARLHRPLPPEALIKRAILVGRIADRRYWRRNTRDPRAWGWWLALTLEAPLASAVGRPGVAEVRFGWAKDHDHLHVATVRDTSSGNQRTILLPLTATGAQRRRAGELRRKSSVPYRPPLADPSHEGRETLQAVIDMRMDAVKDKVGALLKGTPLAVRDQTRSGGLRRRLAKLVSLKPIDGPLLEAQKILTAWEREHDRLEGFLNRLRRQWNLWRRNWYYSQAHSICREFGTLRVASWDFRRLGQGRRGKGRRTDAYALDAGDRYRQLAAPGELREILRHVAAKTGTRWEDADFANGPGLSADEAVANPEPDAGGTTVGGS